MAAAVAVAVAAAVAMAVAVCVAVAVSRGPTKSALGTPFSFQFVTLSRKAEA
jgi:hypothetical protein